VQVPRAASLGRFQFPPGTFPLWRPFQVVFAPPDDTGTTTQPLIPEDLTALDAKTLAKTEADLLKRGNRLKDQAASGETVAELREVVDALGKVRTEVTRRADESAQHEAEKQELLSALEPVAPAAETDPNAPEEEEPPAEPEPEKKPEAPTVEAIAAAAEPREPIRTRPRAPSVANIPSSAVRPESRPNLAPAQPQVTLTAGGDIPGFSAGMPIEERDIGKAFAEKAHALQLNGHGSGSVMSMQVKYPEDRQLSPKDTAASVEERVTAVTASAARTRGLTVNQGTPKALVAAGGLCAPAAVDYSFMSLGTMRRPVRDALVRFGAERGAIRFITPAHLSDVAPGSSLWTNATDAAWQPGMPTKPFLTITCGAEILVKVDALVLAIVVGNFDRMTFPEHFADWWEKAQIYFARYADSRLLSLISASCTATTTAQDLGFARDYLVHIGTAADGYRDRNRMEDDEIVQILAPHWVKGAMRRDFTRQEPGDEAVQQADAEIAGYLAADHIEPTWYLDTPSTGVNQNFTVQGVGPLEGYPAKAQTFMFSPGSFLHLDGGELNLGTEIRDWTLDRQNQVAGFVETLEGVAFKGIEALRVDISVCPNGWTSAPQTLAACGGS
jgi:hypothetical protein